MDLKSFKLRAKVRCESVYLIPVDEVGGGMTYEGDVCTVDVTTLRLGKKKGLRGNIVSAKKQHLYAPQHRMFTSIDVKECDIIELWEVKED